MTKRKTTAKPSARKERTDPLEAYREQSQSIIRLFFSDSTPGFVRDLISSWLTILEGETQIFWNRRAVLEVALPLMLEKAARMGLDVESAGGIAFHAFRESLDCHETGEALQREPTAREVLESQLRREAEAFATLINSKHLPEDVRLLIAESFDHLTDACKDEPESIRVLYPVAMLKLKATGEGSTE